MNDKAIEAFKRNAKAFGYDDKCIGISAFSQGWEAACSWIRAESIIIDIDAAIEAYHCFCSPNAVNNFGQFKEALRRYESERQRNSIINNKPEIPKAVRMGDRGEYD